MDLHVSDHGSLYYLARGVGDATGLVMRIDFSRAASVSLRANGVHGPIVLAPQDSLTIAMAFDAGSASILNPAEVYIGLVTPFGTFWVDAATQQFSVLARPVAAGPLPSFGPVTLFQFQTVSSLPRGTYHWFVAVDNDSNGVPNLSIVDVVTTVIQ